MDAMRYVKVRLALTTIFTVGGFVFSASAAHATIPTDGLLGFWNLDEGSGTAAANGASSSYNGTLIGSPTWTTGHVGSAVFFDANGKYIDMGDITPFHGQTEVSLSAWVKISSPTNWTNVSFDGDTSDFRMEIAGSEGYFWVNGIYGTAVGGFDDTGWHHVVMVYNGAGATNSDRLKAYVDGNPLSLTYSSTIPTSLPNSSGNFYIGRYGATYSRGTIDDVALYNVALTASRVTQLYANTDTAPVLTTPESSSVHVLRSDTPVQPSDIQIAFKEGACVTEPAATLLFHVHNASWYRYGLRSDLSDVSPWFPVENGVTKIHLSSEDGMHTVYMQFMSRNAIVSSPEAASIQLDQAHMCGKEKEEAQPAPEGAGGGEQTPMQGEMTTHADEVVKQDPACISDFEHAWLLPYFVSTDGRKIPVLKHPLTLIETHYTFVEDTDYEKGVLINIEKVGRGVYIHGGANSLSLPYQIRAEVYAGDIKVDDVELWKDASQSSGDQRFIDLDRYKEICAKHLVSHPHAGDVVQGPETSIYYIGSDGKRYLFPDDATYDSWFSRSKIHRWPSYQIASFPFGKSITARPGFAMQMGLGGRYYFIAETNILRQVSDILLNAVFGPAWRLTHLVPLDVAFFSNYQFGKPIYRLTDVDQSSMTLDELLGIPSPQIEGE